MAERDPSTGEPSDYTPNFEFFYRDVIHEHNWLGYAALGLEWLKTVDSDNLREDNRIENWIFLDLSGLYNIYTGDAWDETAEWPSRDIPGVGVYSSPAGLEHLSRMQRQHREHQRRLREDPSFYPFGDLVKKNAGVITATSWPEYAAHGFMPVADQGFSVMKLCKMTNFYTGESWDEVAGQPSPTASGTTSYTSPEGLWHMADMLRKDRDNQRQIQRIQEQFGDAPPS